MCFSIVRLPQNFSLLKNSGRKFRSQNSWYNLVHIFTCSVRLIHIYMLRALNDWWLFVWHITIRINSLIYVRRRLHFQLTPSKSFLFLRQNLFEKFPLLVFAQSLERRPQELLYGSHAREGKYFWQGLKELFWGESVLRALKYVLWRVSLIY